VLVFRTLAAERKPSRRARRASPDGEDAATAPLSRVTVIGARRFEGEQDAGEWFAKACGEESEAEVEGTRRCVNRAVQGHRIAAHDPYVGEVSRPQAHRVRIGYGTGDELVEGGFREAFEVPVVEGRRRRRPAIAPQEELAGILGGRRPAWPSEDLVLRARLDVREGRTRQAALQAGTAVRALVAELDADNSLPPEAFEWLRERVELAGGLTGAALRGDVDETQASDLDDLIAGMERIVRRRRLAAGR
jgi:hypothetical protein